MYKENVSEFFGEKVEPVTVRDLIEDLQKLDPNTVLCKYLDEGGPLCYPLSGMPYTFYGVGEMIEIEGEEPKPAVFPILTFDSVD